MLGSGAKQELYLQDEEILVRHSHDVVNKMINGQSVSIDVTTNGKEAAHA